MPRLSIVIPSLQFDAQVEDTLVSVLQNRPEHSEVIVATATRYDDPYKLGREVRFLSHADATTRLEVANHGFREARGAIVHLILPGVLAVEGWTDHVLRHFTSKQVAAVSPIVMGLAPTSRVAAVGVTYLPHGERRVLGTGLLPENSRVERCAVLAPTMSAGFYRASVLHALQGFDSVLGESFADVELGLALRDLGLSTIIEPQSQVMLSATGKEPRNVVQDARDAERLYRRQTVPSDRRALRHSLLMALEVLAGFPRARMLTRLWGRLAVRREVDPRSGYEARLAQARAHLDRTSGEVSTIRLPMSGAASVSPHGSPARGRRSAA